MKTKPKIKAVKPAKVADVMGEFKRGQLHSGSKAGPKVTKPAQAKAIAMSEAGMSRTKGGIMPMKGMPKGMMGMMSKKGRRKS